MKKCQIYHHNVINALGKRYTMQQEFVNGPGWSAESKENVPEEVTLSEC